MIALFFGLGVLPLLVLGVVSYRQSMHAVEELLAAETTSITQRTARELESRHARYQSDLTLLAENLETLNLLRAHYEGGEAPWESVFPSADAYLQQVWNQFRTSYRWIEFRDTTDEVLFTLGEPRSGRPFPGGVSTGEMATYSSSIQRKGTQIELRAFSPSGRSRSLRTFDNAHPVLGVRGFLESITWSPDGRQISVDAYRIPPGEGDAPAGLELLLLEIDSSGRAAGEPTVLDAPGGFWWWSPRWLPDGRFMPYGRSIFRGSSIWRIGLGDALAGPGG